MVAFSHLIRFHCADDVVHFADLGPDADGPPALGTHLDAWETLKEVGVSAGKKRVTIKKFLAPIPHDHLPIYCVGLNYRSHAKEANLSIPSSPPLWTKPAAGLAHPGEDIPVNEFCAKSLLDYEGELVFVTSRQCRDIKPDEARNYILGYTIGNDLSCRKFQLPQNSGGQFFFAKAFDRFAPIGPSLICPDLFESNAFQVITRVNGHLRQKADFQKDMIFSPEKILSHMSQGTTIPAGTAIMTGTPAGVGVFLKPKSFLRDGDIVEVEMGKVGTLKNKIHFE